MENLSIALLLMLVGMTTVFAILLIVIYLGKLLIALVNKYAPEEPALAQTGGAGGQQLIPANILTVINAAVTVATQGKGKVTHVERAK